MKISIRSVINGFLVAAAVGFALETVAQTQDARPQYKLFRYDEDWSSLAHSTNRQDWLDPLKYTYLGKDDRYLTLGGSMQEKYELLNQPGFGTGPYDPNGYLLQRYLLSADLTWDLVFVFSLNCRAASKRAAPGDRDQPTPICSTDIKVLLTGGF